MLCLLTLSILVFVALTQHGIQSTVRCENSTLLCIKWPLTPLGVRATSSSPLSYGFSSSSVRGDSFVNFLGFANFKGDCRQDAQQSPILKLTKGMLSNLVILTNLQTRLHPPYCNQTGYLVYEFRSKRCFSMLEECGPVEFLLRWQVSGHRHATIH